MNGFRKSVILLALGLLVFSPVFAANITIKLASVAPENSPWGAALNKLAAEWKRISNGSVTLKIYHNGIVGDESDIIRKLRIGQVQGGVFTSFGLGELNRDFMAISMPALVRTNEEMSYVVEKLKPHFTEILKGSGLTPVAFSKAGWVKFFSKQPIMFPADLKSQKLCVGGQDQNLVQTWKVMGYNVVPVAIPQVLSSLNSGMVEALYSSPLAVGGFQWFGLAKHMLNLNVSPFMGAILITDKTLKQIPENLRGQLLEAASAIEKGLDKDVLSLEDTAIKTMTQYGLVTIEPTAEAKAAWFKEFDDAYRHLIGSVISKEIYDKITSYTKEIRK